MAKGEEAVSLVDAVAGILMIAGGVLTIVGRVNLGALVGSAGFFIETIKAFLKGGI